MCPDAACWARVARRARRWLSTTSAPSAHGWCAVWLWCWGVSERTNSGALGEIEHQDRRFRSLIENSADVVTVLDADRRISYESPAAERLLGFTPDERIGQDAFSFLDRKSTRLNSSH